MMKTGVMKTGVAVMLGRRRFAWRPMRLEDGRVAWFRFVHELSPICGVFPLYAGRRVTHTDRMPHCGPGLRDRIRVNLIWMERSVKLLVARLVIGWLVMVETVTVGLGFAFGFHPALNGFRVTDAYDLYIPGQFVTWYSVLHPADRWFLNYSLAAVLLLAAVLAVVGYVQVQKMAGRGDSSRISSNKEARARLR